ncbi:maleylpyruvate isomerase N-terminal domain-containing protein, partial [Nocardioides sp.]|uniref:maleylpyruvate isomerase N-terminal domain-containing protein n=1 Tax=Nocardioides sp. TaxID=35761 RepID=UPI0039C962C9
MRRMSPLPVMCRILSSTADIGPQMLGAMSFFLDAADRFTALVTATTDWSAPSPCEGWSAADVVDHVVDT